MRPLFVGLMAVAAVESSSVGMMPASEVAVTATLFLEHNYLFIFLSIRKKFYEDTMTILYIFRTTNI